MKQEGFWRYGDEKDSDLPFPTAGESWKGQADFLMRLRDAQKKAVAVAYRGWSNCRLCGRHNGSVTYQLGEWDWPEGFAHYVRDHNVRPSPEFEQFIAEQR